jgi:hypothetical protein
MWPPPVHIDTEEDDSDVGKDDTRTFRIHRQGEDHMTDIIADDPQRGDFRLVIGEPQVSKRPGNRLLCPRRFEEYIYPGLPDPDPDPGRDPDPDSLLDPDPKLPVPGKRNPRNKKLTPQGPPP